MPSDPTIRYEATLDDVTEPSVRFYLRSKTARKAKLRSTVAGGAMCAVAMVFILRNRDPAILVAAGLAGALIGACLNFFTYTSTVRGRIRKHLKNSMEGKLPSPTSFGIEDGKLVCDSCGVTISFPLTRLEVVTEDVARMEISFGDTGLCTIPLRAFECPEQKAEFLERLKWVNPSVV